MDPQYFAHTLTVHEALLFLRGLACRYHAAWEQARYVAFYAAKPHCKEGFTFESMERFSWEEESGEQPVKRSKEEEEMEIRLLRERARARDKQYIENLNNGIG